MKKVGFIDYFLHEWHADNYPAWLKEVSGGEYVVTYCWGEIDSPRKGGLTNAQWAEQQGIELCATMEEVIAKSDVLCVLAPDNPETHERLSQLPLRSGKITYIDKTFAPDKATAVRLLDLAEQHGTPCITTSALRFADEYIQAPKEGICGIASMGGGAYDIYCIHQIEPMVMMLGSDVRRVKAVGTAQLPIFLVEYANGIQVTLSCFNPGCPFQMAVNYTDNTCKVLTVTSDIFRNMMRTLVQFFDTGELLVPHAQTIAVMAVREACMQAYERPEEWITLP